MTADENLLKVSRFAKAVSHPLRIRIIQVLCPDEPGSMPFPMSPKNLAELLDAPLSTVSYHVKVLKELEIAYLVKKVPRRGAMEHFYRLKPWATAALLVLMDQDLR